MHRLFVLLIFVGIGALPVRADDSKLEFFEAKIRPVLVKHCYRCHSEEAEKSKGSLLLDSRTGWQVGGDSGPAIVPGKPDESVIIDAISRNGAAAEMPPSTNLSEQIVDDFRKWITDGAIDPRVGNAPTSEKESIDIEAGKQFWSFKPRKTFGSEHSIDRFVQPKAPSAPADKLVRRLFLDLVGLPPSQDQRQEFVRIYQQRSPRDAVQIFADRLLAENQFGEKWARHWLDIARYADSNGGDFNLTFHEGWRYRNYVIDAFNDDMPYDQFLREQIAGDLLPAENADERNRQLVATGYLMVSAKMLTERNKPKMHLDIADEQLDTIGRSIMGLTLGCARCHDHKFDPIPTADYYAMVGILHSTRTADRVLMNNVNVTGWTNTDMDVDKRTQSAIANNEKKIKRLESQIKTKKQQAKNQKPQEPLGTIVDDVDAQKSGPWRESKYRPNHYGKNYLATDKNPVGCSITWKATLPKAGKYELLASFGGGSGLARKARYTLRYADKKDELTVNQTVTPSIDGLWHPIGQIEFEDSQQDFTVEVHLTDKDAGGHVIADAIQFVHLDDLAKVKESNQTTVAIEIKNLENEAKKIRDSMPKVPQAMAAQENANDRMGDLHIRIRGEAANLGKKVPRGFLQVVSYSGLQQPKISPSESGRLQLADWISHENHPLTARVMANRIWQQLFGRGIVVTSDNFGTRGAKPANPELLDFLADRFVKNGWSMKSLIREIVLSETYQQAAMTPSDNDPDNLRIHHQNRRPQSAESIRDSILAIAGQLDPTPKQSVVSGLGMYAIETSGKRAASLGKTDELRQRSIYMPIVRGAMPPSLAVFDMPNPDLVTGKRSETNVPAQALFMMNSPFVRKMAMAVSKRVTTISTTDEIIQDLYQQILIRDADEDDRQMANDYIERLMDVGKTKEQAVASFVQVLFGSTEFRFVE